MWQLGGKCCPFFLWFSNFLKFLQTHFSQPIPIRMKKNLPHRVQFVMDYKKMSFRSTNFITLHGLIYMYNTMKVWVFIFWLSFFTRLETWLVIMQLFCQFYFLSWWITTLIWRRRSWWYQPCLRYKRQELLSLLFRIYLKMITQVFKLFWFWFPH